MLDVHPPHAPTHSWKDFFIHVGTICVGLLIAVGIEQSVEWMHRRHERQELREALKKEHEENARIYRSNVACYRYDRAVILNNLRILQYLQQHPGTPEEKLPGVPRWNYVYEPVVTSAYGNAQQTQTIGLLPQDEAESLANFYRLLNLSQDATYAAGVKAVGAGDFAAIDPNPSHLMPAQLQRQMDLLLEGFKGNTAWAIWLLHIKEASPDLPPGPTKEEIAQTNGWTRSPEDQARLAAPRAITQQTLAPLRAAADAAETSTPEPNH